MGIKDKPLLIERSAVPEHAATSRVDVPRYI